MSVLDWAPGDATGVVIPAHSIALKAGGERFLTRAFHASGVLAADNRVSRITHFEDKLVGGTGSKAVLSVAFEKTTDLPTDLFVKFSRNIVDPFRDRLKFMLDGETRFARLTRLPGFPIAVPTCLFADYHAESGTGILITDRIAFGTGKFEPLYQKCLDYDMPEPLAHYKAIIKAMARLAGTQKAGRLAKAFDEQFPFDAKATIEMDIVKQSEAQLLKKVATYADFAAQFPQLLPDRIRTPEFIAKLTMEIPLFLKHERAIKHYLHANLDYIALCHWNGNIDNAWFWTSAEGELECGLMDWARVAQIPLAQAVWGCFSSAEVELWENHLEDVLAVFADEYRRAGGPRVDVQELKLQLHFVTAMMGLAYLMDAPRVIQNEMPDLATVKDRFDPRFVANETARVQLHAVTKVLTQWQSHDFGAALARFLKR